MPWNGLHYYVRQTTELVRFVCKVIAPTLSNSLSPTTIRMVTYQRGYLSIYKRPEVFSFDASVCLNYRMYMDKWYLIRTGLTCRWFFLLKISIPTAMEWPGTQTCPKTWTIANISETMGRIEILKALYVLQLLILSTGTHFQRVSEHYMVT